MNEDPPPPPPPSESGPDVAPGRVPVFCNVASGRAATVERLRAALSGAGIAAELHRTPPESLASAIARAVAAGAPIVGVAGGDGSISTAAQALVGTRAVLAVFPAGTLNHFAHALGIDDHESAARALAGCSVAGVDVGEVDGRVFVNGVSFGIYPRTLRLRRDWEPRLGKWPAALSAAARAVAEFPEGPLRWSTPGGADSPHPLVWVGAGRGSFRSPRTDPRELDSGVLELVVLSTWSRLELLRMAGRTLRRGLNGLYACEDTRGCTLRYATEFTPAGPLPSTVDAGLDGELVRLHPPLRFRLRPGALRVISPRAATVGRQG